MHNGISRLLPALIGASAIALSAPASASTIPISGTFSGIGSGGTPPVFTESFNGGGTDATFGAFTGFEQATIDVSNPSDVVLSGGTFQWNFATGFIAGTFSGSGAPGALTVNFLITSGLLPGDSGSATGSGSYNPDTSEVTGSYSGSITAPDGVPIGLAPLSSTPLPAALPLFAGGAGFLGLFVRRRKKKKAVV